MEDLSEKKVPITEEAALKHTTSITGPPTYVEDELVEEIEQHLVISGEDFAKAQQAAKELTLEETKAILKDVIQNHENDQNFPLQVLENMKEFIANEDIFENPHKHTALIAEMSVEAALIKNDSPYPEVRAVSDGCSVAAF